VIGRVPDARRRRTARADRRDGGVSQRPVGGFPPRAEPAWCEV